MDSEKKNELLEELKEKQRLLESTRAMLAFDEGELFMKYIFKNLMVTHLPAEGLQGPDLHSTLGVLRAGRTIFEMCVQADPDTTMKILARLEKTRLDNLDKELIDQLRKEE